MKKLIIGLIVTLLIVMSAVSVFAWDGPLPPGDNPNSKIEVSWDGPLPPGGAPRA